MAFFWFWISDVYGKNSVLRRAVEVLDEMVSRFVSGDLSWDDVVDRQMKQVYDLIDGVLPDPPYPVMLVWDRELYTYVLLVTSILPEPPLMLCV